MSWPCKVHVGSGCYKKKSYHLSIYQGSTLAGYDQAGSRGTEDAEGPCDVQDLIGCALAAFDRKLVGSEVKVTHAEEMPFVSMDMVFMDQVLINLLDNALKNTPDMI